MSPPVRHTLVGLDRVPSGSQWLGPDEQQVERRLSVARRRREWRGGRWAAKRLVAEVLGADDGDLSRIQILADDEGAPRAWVDGDPAPFSVSISHRSGWAGAALDTEGRELGMDLEQVEARSERFVRDYFTPAEAAGWASAAEPLRDLFAVAVWSAKESVLKCARTGLRRDTRSVEIELSPVERCVDWCRFSARDRDRGVELDGWWGHDGPLLMTLALPRR